MFASRLLTAAAAAAFGLLAVPAEAAPLLNSVFQDHAVLQRGQPIPLWGTATPRAKIVVAIAGISAAARADASGHWHLNLPALTSGGPYTLSVRAGDATQTLQDILIGDVYLCSGQSNMAFPVMGAIDAGPDIQISANDAIRLMTVANVIKPTPQRDLPQPVKWEAAAPQTVARFSAACYFFGRDLQKSAHVPVGLIHDSWAGANLTAFMSAKAMRKTGREDARLDTLKTYAADPAAAEKKWGKVVEAWWQSRLGAAPWKDPSASADWPVAPKDLGIWTQWKVPALENFAGHVWFRTSVTLTADEAKAAGEISLGTITEEDQTWINGHFVAATFGYGKKRSYALPSGLLHEGANDILVNVFCGWKTAPSA